MSVLGQSFEMTGMYCNLPAALMTLLITALLVYGIHVSLLPSTGGSEDLPLTHHPPHLDP